MYTKLQMHFISLYEVQKSVSLNRNSYPLKLCKLKFLTSETFLKMKLLLCMTIEGTKTALVRDSMLCFFAFCLQMVYYFLNILAPYKLL